MLKHLPNTITVFNLLCGSLSIIFLFSGNIALASWMIGLAAVFDFMDGMLARLLKASSEIGKILDSLADVISFGLAPGLILFRMIQLGNDFPGFLAYIALLVPALSAVRLAIFSADDRQHDHFIGVPTPLNALMIASLPLVLLQYEPYSIVNQIISNTWFLVVLTVVSSLLLVAPVRIMALKFTSFGWQENKIKYLLATAFVILLLLLGYLALPVIYVIYILVSLVDRKGQ